MTSYPWPLRQSASCQVETLSREALSAMCITSEHGSDPPLHTPAFRVAAQGLYGPVNEAFVPLQFPDSRWEVTNEF